VFNPFGDRETVDEYIRNSRMDQVGTWGTDREIQTFVLLTTTPVYTYSITAAGNTNWVRISPAAMYGDVYDDITQPAVYLENCVNHFDVVQSTVTPASH